MVPPTEQNPEARLWNALCHIIACTRYVTGLGFFLGPLLVWMLMRERYPSVVAHGKEALNFQLTVLIVSFCTGVIGFVLALFTCGIGGYLAVAALCVIGGGHLVLMIMAAVQAWSGGSFEYPFSMRFLK